MGKMSELDAALQVVLREMDVLEKQRAELEQVKISVCGNKELHTQVFNILFELSRVEGEIRQAITGCRDGRKLVSMEPDPDDDFTRGEHDL